MRDMTALLLVRLESFQFQRKLKGLQPSCVVALSDGNPDSTFPEKLCLSRTRLIEDAVALEHLLGGDQRVLPFPWQHVLAGTLADVVVPEFLDVPVAHFHALDLLDLGLRERQRLG